jgi:hypothetical protein
VFDVAIVVPERLLWTQARVRVNNDARVLRLRASPDAQWTEVPLFRQIRQYVAVPAGLFVAWAGPVGDDGEDLDVAPDTPMISAYQWDGTLRWTVLAGELPFYGREGARGRGIATISGVEGDWVVRSGPWYGALHDHGGHATMGPARHTSDA